MHNSIVKDKEAVSEIPKDLKRSKPVFAAAAPEARGPDILPFCPLRIAVCRESGPPSPTRYLSLPAACLAVEKGHFVPIFRHIFSRRNAVGLKQKMPRSTKVRNYASSIKSLLETGGPFTQEIKVDRSPL